MPPLPSLDHLRAFEAAARHLSFKLAADELNVTPAAISQRISALESQLKVALFIRQTRKVVLSKDGDELLSAVSIGLSSIRRGVARIQARQHAKTLTISTTNSFAECCLLPLLPEFSCLYPEYELRIIATDEKVDFYRESVDMAIRFGKGKYRDANAIKLAKGSYIPVCAPTLLSNKTIISPGELNDCVLINTDWRVERDSMPTWEKWFKMCGTDFIASERQLSVSVEAHAIRAAINGQGIALANRLFVERDLHEGRLIQVLDNKHALASEFSHYLVWPDSIKSDHIEKFTQWVKTTFR